MVCCKMYTLLLVGLVSQALAEPFREPYQPRLARMSTRNILGLQRREVEGYSPTDQLCGAGDTCAEACGKGFRQCASKDSLIHCYNRSKKQICCPNGSGDSCDNGYFCSADEKGETWCCPEGLSLKECAQRYNIPGLLTSQAPHTSTTSATSKTSTTKATKTKSSDASETSKTSTSSASPTSTSTKGPAATSTKLEKPESTESKTTGRGAHPGSTPTSTSESGPKETTTATPSSSTTTLVIDVTSAAVSTETAGTQTAAVASASSSTLPASSPTTTTIGANGGISHGPVNGLVLFIAGAVAALV